MFGPPTPIAGESLVRSLLECPAFGDPVPGFIPIGSHSSCRAEGVGVPFPGGDPMLGVAFTQSLALNEAHEQAGALGLVDLIRIAAAWHRGHGRTPSGGGC